MKIIITAILLLLFFVCPVYAEFEVTASNLNNAFEIPGSRSPNGTYALFCINRGDTTAKFIAIMHATVFVKLQPNLGL